MCVAISRGRARSRALFRVGLAIGGALIGSGFAPRAALAQPAATDLGVLTTASPTPSGGVSITPGTVAWFKVKIVAVSPAMFLDIDSEGTQLSPTNDTMMGLYDDAGNRLAFNDDDGSQALSELSFGASSPSRSGIGDGVPFHGQDGPLLAGTYYLAVTAFPATFGPTAWAVASTGNKIGTAQTQLRLGPPGAMPVADAGPDQTVPEESIVTLDGSPSTGGFGCPTQLTWSQIAGPALALDLTDPARPTFFAPQVPIGGATLTFRLDVATCPSGSISAVVNVTVSNINHPPTAQAGADQSVAEGSPVVLDGSLSFDPDGDALAFAWSQASGPAVVLDTTDPQHPTFAAPIVGQAGAILTFALGVSDGVATGSDMVSITVENVNHPPVASAGPGGTFNEETIVTLDATASSDPDNDPLTYSWQQISGLPVTLSSPTSPTPRFTTPEVHGTGLTLVFRVTVSDGLLSRTADVTVLVHDRVTPPDCSSARPSEHTLWPPNHKLVPVFIEGLGKHFHNSGNLTILSVTQDEPIRGLGDGDTGPDAVILGRVVLLRAERAGNGNGRVYRINFRVTNPGGSCTGFVRVTVPHEHNHGGAAVDDGQNFNSVGP